MIFVGLDLNATRALAASGAEGGVPGLLPLEGREQELPMALSLEKRHPEVGRAGLELCRRLPHLACVDFLPHLGDARRWRAGRNSIDAVSALSLVLERLQPVCAGAKGLTIALPAYLGPGQREEIAVLAEKLRTRRRSPLPPLLASVSAPLALSRAAHHDQPWTGLAVVADVDNHALTWTAVDATAQEIVVVAEQSLPHLGLKAWKARLLDAVADRCIRQSRRDPRDSAQAEQGLYEQFDGAMEVCRQGKLVELIVQAERWYQNLLLRPDDFEEFCAPLARQAAEAMHALVAKVLAREPMRVVLLAETAGRLPGLAAALAGKETPVTVLPGDAAARSVHELAGHVHRGELPVGHLGASAPLGRVPRESDFPYERVISIRAVDR